MPAPDWLEGLGGAFGGVTQGLTAGAAPFAAWDRVVASGLANDRSESLLRDLQLTQAQREAQPNFYGNLVGAANTGNQLKMGKDTSDLFGVNRNLNFQQDISDPNGLFQQMMRAKGLTPADPEWQQALVTQQSMYDPMGAAASYRTANIPGMQQRNLNEQAVTQYLTDYVHRVDQGAVVIRLDDGTYSVIGSDGTEHSLTADQAIKAAAFSAEKTPFDAVEKGVRLEAAINASNATLYKAMNDGNMTPKMRLDTLNSQRVNWTGIYRDAGNEIARVMKDPGFATLSKEDQAAALAHPLKLRETALERLKGIDKLQEIVVGGGRIPGSAALPGVAPQGAAQVVAPKLALADQVARAIGGGAMGPWGTAAEGPAYPPRRVSPQDTGVQPIGGGGPANFNLDEYVQSLLQQAGAQ